MKRKLLLHISFSLLLTSTVNCQFEEMIVPSDLKQQTIITEPPTLRKGTIRAGIGTYFIMVDRVFNQSGRKEYPLGLNAFARTWNYEPGLQYGINDQLEFYAVMPFKSILTAGSIRLRAPLINYDTTTTIYNKGSGFGDLATGIKYQIFRESRSMPSITIGLYSTLPTGRRNPENVRSDSMKYDIPPGSGNASISFDISFKKIIYPYSITLNGYYWHNFKGNKIFYPGEDPIDFKYHDHWQINPGFGVHLNDWIALVNQIPVVFHSRTILYYDIPEESPNGWVVAYQPAVYFQIRKIRFFETISVPLAGKNVQADPTYIIYLQYLF